MTPEQSQRLRDVFAALRPLLAAHEHHFQVQEDQAERYSLETSFVMKNGQKLWFGSVDIKRRYVSFHLMPVYVEPALLDDMSDALKKRMQGKSCFNFSKIDPALFAELSTLTERSFESYRAAGTL